MTAIILDILGLVRVRASDPSEAVAAYIRRTMGAHMVDDRGLDRDSELDVVLAPFPDPSHVRILAISQGTVMSFAELDGPAGRGIGTIDRGELTTAMFPDRPIQVFYDPRRAGARRVYGLLQQAVTLALRRRDGALLHGACLSDGRHVIALFGARGTGKTRLVLGLLNAGWAYLADDKLVLAHGRVHAYERWIGVRDWHLDACPWLAERLPPDVATRKSPTRRRVRGWLRGLGERHLGKRLAAPWAARFNPAANVEVGTLFPDVRVLASARLDAAVHLRAGTGLLARPLSPEVLATRVGDLQRMAVQDWYPVSELLGVNCDVRVTPPTDADLARRLAEAHCAEVQAAPTDPPERIGEQLTRLAAQSRAQAAPCGAPHGPQRMGRRPAEPRDRPRPPATARD